MKVLRFDGFRKEGLSIGELEIIHASFDSLESLDVARIAVALDGAACMYDSWVFHALYPDP